MPSAAINTIENYLALSWKNLHKAARRAETLSDQGLADDLNQLAEEVWRIQEDLLRGRVRRARTGI